MKQKPKIEFDKHGEMVFHTDNLWEMELATHWRYHPDGPRDFFRYFWPKVFEDGKTWTPQREHYLRRLSDNTLPLYWAMARRGFGKSTIMCGLCAYDLIFRNSSFLLYTSFELDIAVSRTETIRGLCTTPEIIEWFGDMRPRHVDGVRDDWGEMSWRLIDPFTNRAFAACAPNSEKMSLAGKLYPVGDEMLRPDVIINDDGEDRRTIDNEDIRKRHRDWWFEVVMPAVPEGQPNPKTMTWDVERGDRVPWRIRIVDTPKHHDCLIVRVAEGGGAGAESNGWFGDLYPLAIEKADGTFDSLDPDTYSNSQVQMLADRYEANGNPDGFWREYQCSVVRRTEDVFPQHFQHYEDSAAGLSHSERIHRFIISDPSKTSNSKSCPSSILAVGVDRENGRIFLRKQVTGRFSPEEYKDQLFGMVRQLNTFTVCIEGLDQDEVFKHDLQREAIERGIPVHFVSLKTATGHLAGNNDYGKGPEAAKRRRATAVVRLYRPYAPTHPQGHVWHDVSFRNGTAEAQMLSFPKCREWDALDCVSHIPQAMTTLNIFFDRQFEDEDEARAFAEEEECFDPCFANTGFSDEW